MDLQAETTRINEFVDKGNYHAAINIALSAMNKCRRNHDQHGTDHFIDLIKQITDKIAEEFGSKKTSL